MSIPFDGFAIESRCEQSIKTIARLSAEDPPLCYPTNFKPKIQKISQESVCLKNRPLKNSKEPNQHNIQKI